MTLKYNIDRILHNNTGACFLDNLTPHEHEKLQMDKVKQLVRQTIRDAFKKAHELIEQSGIAALSANYSISLEDFSLLEEQQQTAFEAFKKVNPKFRSQGSSVYGTLNRPAQTPPQQMDVDDGVYLPMNTFEDSSPVIGKKAFFKIVDTALINLCRQKGWKFEQKPTCARIVINEPFHFDVPLYAIPDAQYRKFVESQDAVASLSMDQKQPEFILEPNQVYLAMRDEEHWKPSDPKEVSEWFQKQKKLHHAYLGRTCRYIKAWRDHTWPDGAISSIALMACVVETFNLSQYSQGFRTQTEALLACASNLPEQLRKGVILPINDELIYPRTRDLPHQEEVITKAEGLKNTINFCVKSAPEKHDCLAGLTSVFGSRIPNNTGYIELMPEGVRSAMAKKSPHPETEIQPNFRAG